MTPYNISPGPTQHFQYYMGNTKLLSAGNIKQLTQEQQDEYIRCFQDPVYFTRQYIKVVQADRGLVAFDLYPFQERMIRAFQNHRFIVEKCPRQVGKSTVVVAFFLWYILYHQNVSVCIAAQREQTAKGLLKRLKRAYENLPLWLQQGVVKWDEKTIELENGSMASAAATSSSAVRGETHNILLIDEFAHIAPNVADEFMASTFPTISSGETTKLIIVSTPKGYNHFHQLWVESERGHDGTEMGTGNNGFHPISVHWTEVPGRDEAWHKRTLAIMGQEKFDQEYSTEFLVGEDTLISGSKLKTLTFVPDSELAVESSFKGLKIFTVPCYGRKDDEGKIIEAPHIYVICVDTAAGVGGDQSAFTVIDVSTTPYQIVATYADNMIQTMQYPEIIYEMAKYYNDALVLCELTNDLGQQIADILRYEYEYDGILTTVQKPKQGPTVSGGYAKGTMWGLKMNRQVKRMGCATLKTLVETDKVVVNDHRIVKELSTFIKATAETKGYEAQAPNTDDLVMSLVIFAWLTQQQYFIDLTTTNVRAELLQVQKDIWEEHVPFGHVSTGDEDIVPVIAHDATDWSIPREQAAPSHPHDYNWLR